MLDELNRAKPAAAKGRYLRKITVSSTMGPGVRIDTTRLRPEIRHRLRPSPSGDLLSAGRRLTTLPDRGGRRR